MKTVLVTGVGGFCGRHLARKLAEDPDLCVVGAARALSPPNDLSLAAYEVLDITDAAAVRAVIERVAPDWIFNLAGQVTGVAESLYAANLLGPVNILEAVRELGNQAAVLLVGSAAEYGPDHTTPMPLAETVPCHPRGPYALSKHAMTRHGLDCVTRLGMKVAIARPFNIVGAGVPRELVVGAILSRIVEAFGRPGHGTISIGNIETIRDFIAVEDVCEAFRAILAGGHWGEVFNLSTGVGSPIREILTQLLARTEGRIGYRVDPALVRPDEVAVFTGDPSRARQAFGFRPCRSLEVSLLAAWEAAFSAGRAVHS